MNSAEAGANAAKFQNFRAPKIVSERGFKNLGEQLSHQAKWKKSVSQVYREATLPWEWTPELKAECERCGIEYFSAPYDLEAVDMLDPYVSLFKIGSGDITWPEMLQKVASKQKPVLLATGASDIGEVQRAASAILKINPQLVLMQCNTNYTASLENFRHIHLRVLQTYRSMFPFVVTGLSDHTPGHATVLGAVALGARVIEKHFTLDRTLPGPDHKASLLPAELKAMVAAIRNIEQALGDGVKRPSAREALNKSAARKSLVAARDIRAGETFSAANLAAKRPGTGVSPMRWDEVIGRKARRDFAADELIDL